MITFFTTIDNPEKVQIFNGIKIKGRTGKWSMIDGTVEVNTNEKTFETKIIYYGLFEHDTLGDLTDYVIAYFSDTLKQWVEIDVAYDSLDQVLIDNNIIS